MRYIKKQIPSFKDYYVDTNGSVWSYKHGVEKELKLCLDKKGYPQVHLRKLGKTYTLKVHRLVVETFCPDKRVHNYDLVRHLNDIRTDNRLDNLAWGNQKMNMLDARRNGKHNRGEKNGSSKLTSDRVKLIKRLYYEFKWKQSKISRLLVIHATTINNVIHENTWKHIKI